MNRSLNISRSYESGLASNVWNPSSYNNAYYNAFTYDAMGNILTQQRHKRDGTKIEEMSYKYQYANGKLQRNRLYHINDAVSASVDNTDIDDQGTFDPLSTNINQNNNYKYDEEGRLVRDIAEDIAKITWRVDGKVKEIQRGADTSTRFIRFDYDAMGHRIAKHVYDNTGTILKKSTYYILDAQGNQISMYEHEVQQEMAEFNIVERNIFGSSRLGSRKDKINLLAQPQDSILGKRLGHKNYEFSNHLGNVLIVFTDVKTPLDTNSDGTVDLYRVCLQSASDYSPFGVLLDGRSMQKMGYRYGFNTQEKVDEISGSGNHFTALFWEYDTRLGRRWNLDPKPNPSISNYACFANNPILNADPLGDTLRGVSKVSAMRTRNEILNTFQGEKFDAFKKLIQIDKKDNVTFKHINDKKFDEATKDFSADELAMANAYKKSINMSQTHYVDMTKREETLSPQATSALGLPAGTKGAYADSEYGGGVNTSYRGGSLTVVVINSKAQIDFVYASNKVHYNRISTPAELLSHELLGHGVGRVLGTTGYCHNDAIQMTNLYWRVRGYKTFYRDGTYHGSKVVLSPQTAQKIPTHYK